MLSLHVCHRCEKRQRPCAGACACTVDGRDIIEHAQANECPLGKFDPNYVPPPAPPPLQPIPRDQWPLSARVIAKMAQDGEQGVGDTLTRLLAHVGGEQYKRITKRLGYDCGCSAGQAKLNALYPYADAAPPTG